MLHQLHRLRLLYPLPLHPLLRRHQYSLAAAVSAQQRLRRELRLPQAPPLLGRALHPHWHGQRVVLTYLRYLIASNGCEFSES